MGRIMVALITRHLGVASAPSSNLATPNKAPLCCLPLQRYRLNLVYGSRTNATIYLQNNMALLGCIIEGTSLQIFFTKWNARLRNKYTGKSDFWGFSDNS